MKSPENGRKKMCGTLTKLGDTVVDFPKRLSAKEGKGEVAEEMSSSATLGYFLLMLQAKEKI